MTEPSATAEPSPSATPAAPTPASGFLFTEPGCRSDIRLGALLVLMAVFLWLWWGPTTSSRIYLVGAPLLLWGVPWQAWEARRHGRPGYPWKLGIALTVAGLVMGWGSFIGLPDLRYRESILVGWQTQPVGPLLAIAGAWILLWWPWARLNTSPEASP